MQHFDSIIVGQGLAGTVLAHTLIQNGKTFLIIDAKKKYAASSEIAAGVINPVTGMRFAKSWRIDEFLPMARSFYTQLESTLKTKLWYEKTIYRTVRLPEDKNNYYLRRTFEEYKPYCGEISVPDFKKLHTYYRNDVEYVKLLNGAQLNIPNLLAASQTVWRGLNLFLEEAFDFSAIKFNASMIQYKNFSAQNIIFAEGAHGANNPYFDNARFVLDKGEAITITIPNCDNVDIVKDTLSIVPQHSAEGTLKNYWIGATNAWQFENEAPTKEKKLELIQKLESLLNVPYNFESHVAAVRPTTKDRRPIIGATKNHPNVFIFNGLGSKGALLAPFWSNHLVQHIYNNVSIDALVNVARFK